MRREDLRDSRQTMDTDIRDAQAQIEAHTGKSARDNGVQVIARAAAILNALGTEGLSLGQIAIKVGLARSTVQRIVQALETEGLVTAGRKGVKLGPTLARLGSIARMDVKSPPAGSVQRDQRNRRPVDAGRQPAAVHRPGGR
ncbi:helix-turn-helix domain-containing protein [Pseudomonas putida]|uniref:helix-turn-helix domain-containing protein n=1 Tax=Pseudomonas putida TaxID=303 RepID=UPI002DBD773B|nr:helix-turn-helix domain-containing protein [Pseudomonas putida]WRW03108.1 helix-turn-helix domain-containing protein [Pseudomonas putida]